MSSNRNSHLNEEQFLKAVLNDDELPWQIREHLESCSTCRSEKERLETELAQLGRMSRDYVPPSTRPFSLNPEGEGPKLKWLPDWRVCGGAAVAAGLVLLLFWVFPSQIRTPEKGPTMLADEVWESEQFMAEINGLVENALPPVYLDISGETDPGFDETFMEFLVPPIETESLSQEKKKGGSRLC
jgi:hypothetical protein